MSKLKISFFCLSALLLYLPIFGQVLQHGPQVLSFQSDIDDTEQPYAVYIPPNYNPAQSYPLVVMLHGAGSNHRLGLRRVFGKSNINGENDVEASRYFPAWKSQDYIVAATYARGTMGYQGIAEKDVLDMIVDVKKRFTIDDNRMYLTGLSMGGGGTLWLGLSYPDMWAAIAPVCPAVPTGTEVKAVNALNIPVHIFQGGADPVVSPENVRNWVARLKKEGVQVSYQEYPDVKHDSWVNAYQDEFIFEWFRQFKRNPYPDRVSFSTDRYQHNSAYWVKFDDFTPGIPASINAELDRKNNLNITTRNLQGFTLELAEHPKFKKSKKLTIKIDGQSIKTQGEASIHLSLNGKNWETGTSPNYSTFKHKGAEGPMAEVLSNRHIYVYGTGGNPTEKEIEQRRQQAEEAANWSLYRGEFLGRIMVFPRVLSDQEVRPADLESANLILFGDRETNAIIEKYQAQLPLHLQPSSNGAGLAYIFPVGAHYVFINSGLSIFDAPESSKEIDGLSRYASPPIVYKLQQFEDFVLYDKEKILVNGRFDKQWQLDEATRRELEKSGIVKIK